MTPTETFPAKDNGSTPYHGFSPAHDRSDANTVDLRRYLRILHERRWAIAAFVAVVAVAVGAWTLRQTPIYRAVATVQVGLRAPAVLGREVEQVEELGSGSYWNNQEYLRTQYKIIQSREVAARVVEALKLDEMESPEDGSTSRKSAEYVAEELREEIDVTPVADSRLIQISIEDPDPLKAQQLANAVADAYLAQNVDRSLRTTDSAVNWLSSQLEKVQDALGSSERAVYDFRRERDILSISLEDRQNISANQIQRLADELTSARTKRIELSSKVSELRRALAGSPIENAGLLWFLDDDSLTNHLRVRLRELEEEHAGLSKTYGPNWPRVRTIENDLSQLRRSLNEELDGLRAALEADYRAALATENGIKSALDDEHARALALNVHEIEYNQLTRAAKNNADMYDLLLNRTKEAELARLLNVNNLHILDYATAPERPVKPNVPMNMLVALFFGLFGGVLLAFILDLLDVSVKSQEDVEGIGVTVLGVIPKVEKHTSSRHRFAERRKQKNLTEVRCDLFAHDQPMSNAAESCRSIRTNLVFMSAAEQRIKSLLITSPGPREGKTTVAANLATVMAQGGDKVVLVDVDLRRPRVHSVFGIKNEVGLSSAIVGRAAIDDIISETDIEGLSIVTSGPIPPNPAELLHTASFRKLLDRLCTRFDRVVLDSPPLGPVTDAAILATTVDGVAIVVKNGGTRKDAVKKVLGQLKGVNSRVLGVVLNSVDFAKQRYGYYNYYYRATNGYYSDEYRAKPNGEDRRAYL